MAFSQQTALENRAKTYTKYKNCLNNYVFAHLAELSEISFPLSYFLSHNVLTFKAQTKYSSVLDAPLLI